jgi:hypothetical protein
MRVSSLSLSSFKLSQTISGATVTGTVNVSGNTATFTPSASLAGGIQYTATITTAAKDAAGNGLAANFSWTFTIALAPANTAILSWDAVTDANFSGYRVYYGTAQGTYIQSAAQGINVGNVLTYTVSGLNSGSRYYFAVTAYDTLGNESTYSNEVFKDVP